MSGRVQSVNIGLPVPGGPKGLPSGIAKLPAPVIEVRAPGPKLGGLGSGVVGDFLGDRRHHGGDQQAVYAVAREELDWWAGHLGRELPDGMFGENLTTSGLDVDASIVGEVWNVGTAVLKVTGPRVPCVTFASRMREKGWVKRFAKRGRTGAYLAVIVGGEIRSGDAVTVSYVPDHALTVPDVFRAWQGDTELIRRVLALVELDDADRTFFTRRLRAAERSP